MSKRLPQQFMQRLHKACHAVPGLDKLGKGETDQDYDWVKAAQIFTAFRHELQKADILILPNELEVTARLIRSNAGATLNEVILKKEFLVQDCRSAEKFTLIAFGMAQDFADKALNKAKTAAFKYFLRDLGVIPWIDVDDSEADRAIDDVTAPVESKKRGSTSARQLSNRNVVAFARACQDGGKNLFQQAEYVLAQGVKSVEELSPEQFNKAMKWAYKNGDLAETGALSLRVAERKKAEPVMVPDPEHTSQAGD